MLTTRLVVGTLLNLAAASLALAVGARLSRRPREGAAGRAAFAFSVWWMALGVDTTINSVTWLAGGMGIATPGLTAVLTYAALAAVCVMLWGLVEYLVYLFTGRPGAYVPLVVLYALAFAGGAALIAYLHPTGVTMTRWGGAIAYERQPSPVQALGFAVFFLLPPIVGSLAYGSLFFSAKGRTQRLRIAVVSLATFVWFAMALALSGGSHGDAVALGSYAIAVGCILAIFYAYVPPAWLKARLGVTAIHEEPHAVPEAAGADAARAAGAQARARRRANLDARMRELV